MGWTMVYRYRPMRVVPTITTSVLIARGSFIACRNIMYGNYMRKCASGGQSLANAERGVSMCGFAGKIDTEFFITNVLLCIIIGNPGPNKLVAHFRM